MRMIVLVVLVGCAPKNVRDVLGMAPDLAGSRVAILEPALMVDLEPPAEDMDVFRAGTWVGSIWFGGGYEILAEEQNQVRSVTVELRDADPFRAQARRWTEETVTDAVRDIGWDVVSAETEGWSVSAPERRPIRGSVKHDGDDNVNLPRFDLAPGTLEAAAPIDADMVLAPVLVQYYAHNAGWFIGQSEGSWAGARVRVLWSLHAANDGRLLGWGDVGTKAELEKLASPNQQQMQDLLLEAEAEAEKLLGRQLLGK